MPLFVVQRTAFEDMIVTEGTTEAQSSVNIPTPDDLEGTISFILENGTHVKAGDTVCIIDAPEAETEYDERKKRLESRLAELARQHNNANVLGLPANFISAPMALDIVRVFFQTDFEGGRHERRVNKIAIHE